MKTASSIGIGCLAVASAFFSVELLTASAAASPAAGQIRIAKTRVGAAIQELYYLAEGSAAILIDELLDGPSS